MEETTIRYLRNHGGDVIDRVVAGEYFIVTRDGKPVAELRPLPRQPLTRSALLARFAAVPAMDPTKFFHDLDAVIDQSW